MKFILASSSPRRKNILKRFQIPFNIIVPNINESTIAKTKNPKDYCSILAKLKAEKISKDFPHSIIIAADTIVVIEVKTPKTMIGMRL